MIVGNGLIARSFADLYEDQDTIIFASGVSNSQLTDEAAYRRERVLIEKYTGSKNLFVYFSTVSVLYPCMSESMYVQFKKETEQFILDSFPHAMIFRLPNLVGFTNNPFTLTNYLYHTIRTEQKFKLHSAATRYLLDVTDMTKMCEHFIENYTVNTVNNIVLDNKAGIIDIVQIFENLLNKKALYTLMDRGCDLDLDPISKDLLSDLEIEFHTGREYNINLINRYYSGQRDQ